MTDTAPSLIAARMAADISTVADIGRVHTFSPWDREDLERLIVADIGGERKLRTWWIQGPLLPTANWTQGFTPTFIDREWSWEIHGIEGLTVDADNVANGADMAALRDLMVAVMDVLDTQPLDLDGLVYASSPCTISDDPSYVELHAGAPVCAHVVISKSYTTVPNR